MHFDSLDVLLDELNHLREGCPQPVHELRVAFLIVILDLPIEEVLETLEFLVLAAYFLLAAFFQDGIDTAFS